MNEFQQGVCLDVYPPKEFGSATQNLPTSAIFFDSALWGSGSRGTLKVAFSDGSCDNCLPGFSWSVIGNQADNTNVNVSMNLGFIDPPFQDFVVDGFRFPIETIQGSERSGCTKDAQGTEDCISNYKPGGTVLHEFCHALGMLHEHQNDLKNLSLLFLLQL